MHRKLVPALLACAALLLALSGATGAAQGPYGKAGRWITDDQGRVAVLNGWNVINKIAPFTLEAEGFGEDDARFIRAQGFDTVRLGLSWEAAEPKPGRYDEAYLDSIERTYDLLAAQGIAVLLSFHQDMYSARFQGEGFPDWAVLGDARTLPNPRFRFPTNYAFNYAMQRAFDHFWNNERLADGRRIWDAYAQVWQHIAQRFAGKPELLGYNLLNEPFAGTAAYTCFKKITGCARFDLNRLMPLHKLVTKAIRSVDGRGIVWYAPQVTFNFGIRTYHGDLGDDHAGFAFNTYCQFTADNSALGLLTYYHWGKTCGQMSNMVMGFANEQAAKYDDAVLLTEWGGEDNPQLFEATARNAEKNMQSWQEWAYFSDDPSKRRPKDVLVYDPKLPPTGANVKSDRLALSARVRPSRVSGTPLSWSYVPAVRRFDFTFTTLRPGQAAARFDDGSETSVEVPVVQFPGDYAVAVAGARVTSAPGARQATFASCPGAQTVKIAITPGSTSDAARTCG